MPLVFLSPTSQKFVVLFALFFVRCFLVKSVFACVLVCVVMMPQRKYYDVPYPNIFLEIEKCTKEYMTTQFEHNKYFTKELKEHSVLLEAITKQLDDISREVCNLQSKYAFVESLLGKISDAQATLVNQMAAKPISLENKNDDL